MGAAVSESTAMIAAVFNNILFITILYRSDNKHWYKKLRYENFIFYFKLGYLINLPVLPDNGNRNLIISVICFNFFCSHSQSWPLPAANPARVELQTLSARRIVAPVANKRRCLPVRGTNGIDGRLS